MAHGQFGVRGSPLTAGFADTVDRRHPEVGGARVEHHSEILGGCPDGDLPKILHLPKSGAGSPVSHQHTQKSQKNRAWGSEGHGWGTVFDVPGGIKETNI